MSVLEAEGHQFRLWQMSEKSGKTLSKILNIVC